MGLFGNFGNKRSKDNRCLWEREGDKTFLLSFSIIAVEISENIGILQICVTILIYGYIFKLLNE